MKTYHLLKTLYTDTPPAYPSASHFSRHTRPPPLQNLKQVLAKKMTVLYKLSKEQLSKQYHYDFGLRALKSVLVMAGGLKRQYSDMPEDLVLMRALRDSNMPKFVFEDVPLFKGLINDLFPSMDCPRVGYEHLKVEVRKELETKGFRCSDDQVFADQVSPAALRQTGFGRLATPLTCIVALCCQCIGRQYLVSI